MLDSWTYPHQSGPWSFRVTVEVDPDSGRPEECKPDVYDPDKAEDTEGALLVVQAWDEGEWEFVCVEVTPVLELPDGSQIEFDAAKESLSSVEWGSFPSGDPNQPYQGRDQINAYPVEDLVKSSVGEAERLRSLMAAIPPMREEDDPEDPEGFSLYEAIPDDVEAKIVLPEEAEKAAAWFKENLADEDGVALVYPRPARGRPRIEFTPRDAIRRRELIPEVQLYLPGVLIRRPNPERPGSYHYSNESPVNFGLNWQLRQG